MALTSGITKPLAIPHEPGQEITVRMLSWVQLKEARERRTAAALQAAKDLGAELFSQLQDSSWWDTLGVDRDAPKADVARAYRDLAKVHHPDAGGDPEFFRRLKLAYERGMAAAPPKLDAEKDPLDDYDQGTVLRHGVIAWSYRDPVTPENVADLDPTTAEWAAREICRLSDPQRTEEERLNGSSPSTST